MTVFVPCLVRGVEGGELRTIGLGHPALDDYLAFVAARARTNTWLAVASDLKIFFSVVGKPPAEVRPADVFEFLAAQRAPRGNGVVRLDDGEAGLAARTIARRLSKCVDCSPISLLVAMPASRTTRSRRAWRLGALAPAGVGAASR